MVKLNKANLSYYAEKYKWRGNGLKTDPYVIENVKKSDFEIIVIVNLSNHFLIRDCSFKYIGIVKCQNIKIENSVLERIIIYKCINIQIKECRIGNFSSLLLSSKITIQKSIIEKFNIYYSNSLIIQDNKISNKSLRLIENSRESTFPFSFYKPNIYFSIINSLFLFFLVLLYIYTILIYKYYNFSISLIIVPFSMFLIINYVILIIRLIISNFFYNKIKDSKPNKVEGNTSISRFPRKPKYLYSRLSNKNKWILWFLFVISINFLSFEIFIIFVLY